MQNLNKVENTDLAQSPDPVTCNGRRSLGQMALQFFLTASPVTAIMGSHGGLGLRRHEEAAEGALEDDPTTASIIDQVYRRRIWSDRDDGSGGIHHHECHHVASPYAAEQQGL